MICTVHQEGGGTPPRLLLHPSCLCCFLIGVRGVFAGPVRVSMKYLLYLRAAINETMSSSVNARCGPQQLCQTPEVLWSIVRHVTTHTHKHAHWGRPVELRKVRAGWWFGLGMFGGVSRHMGVMGWWAKPFRQQRSSSLRLLIIFVRPAATLRGSVVRSEP